jgi:uncharacterized membrane protein
MLKTIRNLFLKGLATVLPIGITIYLVYWLSTSAEALLGRLIKLVIPDEYYWPGMGLVIGLVLIVLIGILVNAWVIRNILGYGHKLLARIPFIKTVYGALTDLMRLFATGKEKGKLKQVVTAKFGEATLIGFVTRDNLEDLPLPNSRDLIAVYFPMSYQIGGYTAYLPRNSVTPIDIPIDQAMSMVLTAGITSARTKNVDR